MLWILGALLLYLAVGTFVAACLTPVSWPLQHNARVVTLLWPWPIAAQVVWLLTGRYPRWTPPL